MKEIRKDIFGWFDNPLHDEPTHDPDLDGICAICAKKLQLPVKTISLMKEGDSRSYFYRTHKNCYEELSEQDIIILDSSLIDNL